MAAKRAGDIMIPLDKYPHIPHWFTLRQAVAEMEKSTLEIDNRQSLPRSLLVFDKEYRLLGTARRRDILRALEPNFLHSMHVHDERSIFEVEADPNLAEISLTKLSEAIRKQAEMKISSVILPIVATVNVDDHLVKIIHIMLGRDLDLIPVLKEDKVVGVVCSVGVFKEIAQMLL